MIAIGSLVYLFGSKTTRNAVLAGRKSILTCLATPGLLFLLLFFSLAVHMHSSFGKWPKAIGNHGFSPALNAHAELGGYYCSWFSLFTPFAWPVVVAIFAIVTRLRRYLPHVLALGVSFWISFPWMFLAPSGFVYWWWD